MRSTIRRISELDLVERWGARLPGFAVQVPFGLACTAGFVVARTFIDLFVPTAGPYALIYPAALISTLYGRLGAGVVTWISSFLFAWYFVLPDPGSFHFAHPSDGPRTLINGLAAGVIIGFAEIFRRAVRRAVRERDAEIVQRDLLLRELDHRTKNNFMIVASLLELQMRRQDSAPAREALAAAVARVHSFAAAHQSLYQDGGVINDVAIGDYLRTLADNIAVAIFQTDRVRLVVDADDMRMPRDQAVSIGVALNEIVTNAAKHAFGPDGEGLISIEFRATTEGWRLVVTDDGCGVSAGAGGNGLGTNLIEAFARRAGGEVMTERLNSGTRVTLRGSIEA